MTLVRRLWLSGALFPLVVMTCVFVGADHWFHLALERSLDQALLAQAAVESVSLFDGPGQQPHLHMAISPLVESVRPFAPEGVLFGPDGHEVMRYPPPHKPRTPERLLPQAVDAAPVLTTRQKKGSRERELVVSVASPRGEPYTLRLTAAMAQLDAAADTSHKLMLAALLVAGLVLLSVQTWQARGLARRLGELAEHVELLRAGDLDRTLVPERERDELSALRDVLVDATLALKNARDAKERLLADAAHELRTPLTLMRTSLDLALRRERSVPELRSALTDTREEVDRLALLSSMLLDVASFAHDERPFEACDISALIEDAVAAVRAEAAVRGIEVTRKLPHTAVAWVRVQALRQAVDNLLSNALKYAASRVEVRLLVQGQHLQLRVHDDGQGIPESERELVFEPFHRVRGALAGAGLGLAIVRKVAASHRGSVAVVSPEGEGAELVLEFPTRALTHKE